MLIIVLSVFSSGIFVFIMKILIEKSLKSYFDNNFEKKKARLELKKDIISKREDKKIEILEETMELLYRNRNHYRYMFSLLSYYVDPTAYEGYEKYLETGDNMLTSEEMQKKIETTTKKITSRGKLREILFKNSIYLDRCREYIHDTTYAYLDFNQLIYSFNYSSKTQDIERNKITLLKLYDLYDRIDSYYQLTNKYVTDYINIEI